jgi:hypothetical protein
LSDEKLRLVTAGYPGRIRVFEEQRECFGHIGPSLFDCAALAGDIELRAKSDASVSLSFDQGGQTARGRMIRL